MDYEIAYKEVLDNAKKVLLDCTSDERNVVEYIFPELRESEEEKIKKELIDYIKSFPEKIWMGHDKKDVIAWLEKQKEFVSTDFDDVWETADCDELTAPLEKYSKDAIKKMCHAWYDKGIELERKSWLEKQGKQKQTQRKDFISIPFGAFDSELIEESITIPDGCVATIEGRKVFIRKKYKTTDDRL